MIVSQIIFTISALIAFGIFGRQVVRIRRNIFLGKPEKITGNVTQRLRNMLLIAFGQQKMFKRVLPALMHLCVYVAFIITQIELIEILADGILGKHRLLWTVAEGSLFAGLYTFVISFIEILSVLALLATFVFLARRNLLKIPRFHKSEMTGWPKLDGNIILYFEIYLVTCIFMMNSGDLALQARDLYHSTQPFAISQFIAPLWAGLPDSTVILIERIGWWGHILGVFVFLNYLPHSKHLHILLAFPNTYYAKLTPHGQLDHMPEITKEVKALLEDEEEPLVTQAAVINAPTPNETVDDIFGEENQEESLDDIFGDAGSSDQEEDLDDIFGDTGNSEQSEDLDDIFGDTGNSEQSEDLDDIFGDTGNSEQSEDLDDIFGDTGSSEQSEDLDDIFGDTGSSEQSEDLDDIFGDTGSSEPEESLDDIFGDNDSSDESVDDIFGNDSEEEESIDDLFGEEEQTSPQPQTQAVQAIVEPPEEEVIKFGAADIFDLRWKNILDAYTCTECGRCTSMCPANLTGKKLSPRKIMMDVRDRAAEVGKNIDTNKVEFIKSADTSKTQKLTKDNYDDGKNLFDYISQEELHACTTCNACVEACPILINPLDIIVQLRRNLILDKAEAPEAWSAMFTNIENNAAPWQFSQNDRANWVEELE